MQKEFNIPGTVVKKNNELIRTKINIESIDSSRILANLVACIKHDDTTFRETYRVAVKKLILDTGGKAYTQVKKACRELAKATAEIEEPDTDASHHPFLRIYTFFSSITCRKGVIEARFNREIQPFLMELKKCFTQYNLLDYLSLPSIYSQRMFEILKSWENVQQGYIDIELFELHKILNTPETQKADFRQFRIRVLEKAHKDINGKTDLNFDWKAIKKGRAVERIRFSFNSKKGSIAEESKEQQKAERQRKLESQRFIRAASCAKDKKGICENQDNVGIVCRMCLKYSFCDEMRKKYQ